MEHCSTFTKFKSHSVLNTWFVYICFPRGKTKVFEVKYQTKLSQIKIISSFLQPEDMFVCDMNEQDISGPPLHKKLKKSQCTPLFMNAYTMRGM